MSRDTAIDFKFIFDCTRQNLQHSEFGKTCHLRDPETVTLLCLFARNLLFTTLETIMFFKAVYVAFAICFPVENTKVFIMRLMDFAKKLLPVTHELYHIK